MSRHKVNSGLSFSQFLHSMVSSSKYGSISEISAGVKLPNIVIKSLLAGVTY